MNMIDQVFSGEKEIDLGLLFASMTTVKNLPRVGRYIDVRILDKLACVSKHWLHIVNECYNSSPYMVLFKREFSTNVIDSESSPKMLFLESVESCIGNEFSLVQRMIAKDFDRRLFYILSSIDPNSQTYHEDFSQSMWAYGIPIKFYVPEEVRLLGLAIYSGSYGCIKVLLEDRRTDSSHVANFDDGTPAAALDYALDQYHNIPDNKRKKVLKSLLNSLPLAFNSDKNWDDYCAVVLRCEKIIANKNVDEINRFYHEALKKCPSFEQFVAFTETFINLMDNSGFEKFGDFYSYVSSYSIQLNYIFSHKSDKELDQFMNGFFIYFDEYLNLDALIRVADFFSFERYIKIAIRALIGSAEEDLENELPKFLNLLELMFLKNDFSYVKIIPFQTALCEKLKKLSPQLNPELENIIFRNMETRKRSLEPSDINSKEPDQKRHKKE